MVHLKRPAEISGVSASSFPETEAGNRAYNESGTPIVLSRGADTFGILSIMFT